MKYFYGVIPACLCILLFLSAYQMTEPGELQPEATAAHKKALIIQYEDGAPVADQYIVVFKDQAIQHPQLAQYPNDEARAQVQGFGKRDEAVDSQQLMKRNGIMRQEVSPLIQRHQIPASCIKSVFAGRAKGTVMTLDASQVASLQHDDKIAFIEQDRIVALSISPVINTPFMPSQVPGSGQAVPYGITRVGGSINFIGNPFYIYRWAWIIDTGIDMSHPDLNVAAYFAANFTTDPSVNDQHGHGTHVAGIVAARDNSMGVKGVAVGAPSAALDNAILAIVHAGIKVVIASGNSGLPVSRASPARVNHPKVFTVAAIDNNDQFAYVSGTSMAAPHMTGVLILKGNQFTSNGSSSPDPTGRSVPVIAH